MTRKTSHWLKSYMQYTAPLEAPDELHFWSGVGTIAAALRGKTWMDMGYWKWKPNFFIIFVARPGIATKSTTIGVGQELLRHVKGVHFAPDSATWQAVTDTFVEAKKKYTYGGNKEYIDSSLTIVASELGTFLDPRNREMVDVLVDLWDGKATPWKRRTRGEGSSEIANPWVNLIGATTPSWMEGNFPEYAIRGGFTSRTLFVFADKKRHYAAYPSTLIDAELLKLKQDLIDDLIEISKIVGPYKLTKEAMAWGTQWYQEHWEKAEVTDDRVSGYLSRKQTHLHKLALVLAAASRDEQIIDVEEMQQAKILLEAVEGPMLRALGGISDSPQVKQFQVIIEVLRRHPNGISKTALWRSLVASMSEWHFNNAVTGAINAGLVKVTQKSGGVVLLTLRELAETA